MFGRSRPPIVSVTEPCTEEWDAMPIEGDGQRYCSRCDKAVYELAGMTGREVETLFAQHADRVCVRAVYDGDGNLVVRPDPPRVRHQLVPLSVLTIATAAISATSSAQENHPGSCRIEIVVTDVTHAPVANASIAISGQNQSAANGLQGQSDLAGELTETLKPGDYSLEVQSPGFAMAKQAFAVRCENEPSTKVPVELQVGQTGGGMICKRPNIFQRSWTRLSARLQTAWSLN